MCYSWFPAAALVNLRHNHKHIPLFKVDSAQFTFHPPFLVVLACQIKQSIRKLARRNRKKIKRYTGGISVISMFESSPTFMFMAQENPGAPSQMEIPVSPFWHSSHMLNTCDGIKMGTHDCEDISHVSGGSLRSDCSMSNCCSNYELLEYGESQPQLILPRQ